MELYQSLIPPDQGEDWQVLFLIVEVMELPGAGYASQSKAEAALQAASPHNSFPWVCYCPFPSALWSGDGNSSAITTLWSPTPAVLGILLQPA